MILRRDQRISDGAWSAYRPGIKAADPLAASNRIKIPSIGYLYRVTHTRTESKPSAAENQTDITEQLDDDNDEYLKEEEGSTTKQPTRTAEIYKSPSGDAHGAAIWLNSTELTAVGINVKNSDAIKIQVEDGELRLVPVGGDDN